MRLDRLSELEDGTLNSTGDRIYKEGVEALMAKDARSIGMPITNLSHEVRRHLAKWGTQQAPRHLSTSNHSINQ